jgi:hypothetical protein
LLPLADEERSCAVEVRSLSVARLTVVGIARDAESADWKKC